MLDRAGGSPRETRMPFQTDSEEGGATQSCVLQAGATAASRPAAGHKPTAYGGPVSRATRVPGARRTGAELPATASRILVAAEPVMQRRPACHARRGVGIRGRCSCLAERTRVPRGLMNTVHGHPVKIAPPMTRGTAPPFQAGVPLATARPPPIRTSAGTRVDPTLSVRPETITTADASVPWGRGALKTTRSMKTAPSRPEGDTAAAG